MFGEKTTLSLSLVALSGWLPSMAVWPSYGPTEKQATNGKTLVFSNWRALENMWSN